MKTLGIIGFGGFGELAAHTLANKFEIKVYSRTISKVPESLRASLAEVGECDYIILSIPLSSYRTVLQDLAAVIKPSTVIVDVCSVKVIPCQIIKELLPGNRLVATHPLFGPQTTANGLGGLTMVVCDDMSDKEQADKVSEFCTGLGLDVVRISTEDHDKQMAKVHALTFFVARGLMNLDTDSVSLKTPSFGNIESLINLERNHTYDLFETIELGNPYSAEVRKKVINELKQLDDKLNSEGKVY